MYFYEVDKIVRDNLPNHRLYDWRQIERWREALAAYGLNLSSAEAQTATDNKAFEALDAFMQEQRAAGNYAVSDRLRDILAMRGWIHTKTT